MLQIGSTCSDWGFSCASPHGFTELSVPSSLSACLPTVLGNLFLRVILCDQCLCTGRLLSVETVHCVSLMYMLLKEYSREKNWCSMIRGGVTTKDVRAENTDLKLCGWEARMQTTQPILLKWNVSTFSNSELRFIFLG